MDGLGHREEKPSNTEVLGLLMDEDKLKFITNLNANNIKALCKMAYLTKRLENPKRSPLEISQEVLEDYLALKCSLISKKGTRAEVIADTLKNSIEDPNQDNIKSIANEIGS